MLKFAKKSSQWVFATVLVLFVLEVLTLPVVIYFTYAGKSELPDHILRYADRNLSWEKVDGIDANGVARLSFFQAAGHSYYSDNGEPLVLPGEDINRTIRLYNETSEKAKYTALIYKITSDPDLPVRSYLGSAFSDPTDNYPLPDGVSKESVISAVTGYVPAHGRQDFDIRWVWDYFDSDVQDILDTRLGDLAAFSEADTVQIGFYIVIETDDGGVTPKPPPTGDMYIGGYVTLLIISGIVLLLLILSSKRESKKRSEEDSSENG